MALSLIFRNALRNRRRSALTVLSIAASFCILGVLMAMYSLFFLREPAPGQEVRLIVRNRISFTNPVPLSYGSRIRAIPGVRDLTEYEWFGGVYRDEGDSRNSFARVAIQPDKLFVIHPDYRMGEPERISFLRERDACIVGRTLARRLGFRVGDHVTLRGDIFPVTLEFVVRGMYDSERDNETLYFRFDYLNETLFKGTQNFTGAYIVMADRPEDVPAVARSIDDTFRNSTVQTRTESEQSFLLSVISYLGNVKLFLLAVSAALTGTVLLVSSNTMAMSVRERFAEVGVLRTLGFTRGNILTLIVGEALVVALAGAALGFCAAEALVLAMRRLHPPLFSLSALAIPPGALLIGAVLAAAIGVLSSAVPAWSAARRGIVDCLRIAD